MQMDTLEVKTNLYRLIDETSDVSVLEAIQTLLARSINPATDFWTTLSESEKNDIERGIADVEAGRVVSFEEVMAKHGLWKER
jgi:predicted transcriptional regulator